MSFSIRRVLIAACLPEGKDDPRLVAFAMTLARARFAVLAALEPDIRERVRFIVAVGGYHDLFRAI